MAEYKLNYDTEASGPFQEDEILTFSGGATAQLVLLYDNGTTGEMYISLLTGSVPVDNETITGGTSAATAAVDSTVSAPYLSRFPLKIRDDTSYTQASGNIRWTGPNLGTTHSCDYDAESGGPFTLGETLTFSGGATAELIQLTDNGTTGILYFRLIGTTIPVDNETITGGTSSATAAVNGAVFTRCYQPQEIHYWLADKGDDAAYTGDDQQDRAHSILTRRNFQTIVVARGNTNIDDTMSYHMYGGSWEQNDGDDLYAGFDIAIVDPSGTTEPVIIQNNALLSATTTEYWNNAYMSDSASKVRLCIKVRASAADIDRKALRFRALERGDAYFTAPEAIGGSGITPVSLVTSADGNDTTIDATVATWTDVTLTTGYQTVDHNNGNGAQPYWGVIDRGARTASQTHERFKWVQRRGTSETISGINAQLFVGNDLDIPYDTEASGPFSEDEVLTFSGGGTALLLALDDNGTTGTLYCQRLTGDAPANNETITGGTSSATAAVNGTVTTRLITNNLVGVYTGSAFNPANRGITLEAADAITDDLFTDLLGATQSPPNNQNGIVNTATGNYVTVYPYDGSSVDSQGDPIGDFDFRTLSTALTSGSETAVVVNSAIPSWVPSTGFLRITTNAGQRRLIAYTSYTGSTFTIGSTDFTGDNASIGNGAMPSPIDNIVTGGQESFTGVYASDQQFVIRASNSSGATPKQPAFTTATFGSGGFNVTLTLQDD